MRFFLDTEFIEDGKTIDLISIGIVHEYGASYYAVSSECNLSEASPWVRENVLPYLGSAVVPKSREEIRKGVYQFVNGYRAKAKPEFWGYYADYDWVALCQLFGTMMDLPREWPMYCRDVKQLCDDLGNPELPKHNIMDGPEHNALSDARWIERAYTFLQERK